GLGGAASSAKESGVCVGRQRFSGPTHLRLDVDKPTSSEHMPLDCLGFKQIGVRIAVPTSLLCPIQSDRHSVAPEVLGICVSINDSNMSVGQHAVITHHPRRLSVPAERQSERTEGTPHS